MAAPVDNCVPMKHSNILIVPVCWNSIANRLRLSERQIIPSSSSSSRRLWGALSKALAKSRYTESILLPLSS